MSFANRICVSNSPQEPNAIDKNCKYSPVCCLRYPSAIFEGIEIADLRICEVSPYISAFGKFIVILYTKSVN